MIRFDQYPFPEPFEQLSYEQQLTFIRDHRNALLKESDWTQVADSPVDKQAWAEYRQQLRDYPNTWTPSDKVEFPATPKESVK
jgi:hypothetical protein